MLALVCHFLGFEDIRHFLDFPRYTVPLRKHGTEDHFPELYYVTYKKLVPLSGVLVTI